MARISGLTRLGMVVALATLPLAGAAVLPTAHAQDGTAVTKTRTITDHGTGDTSDVTVRVDKTGSLFDREQVRVELSGFAASWNANNTAGNGTRVEYPVVVMQCRGADPARTTCLNPDRVQWHAGFDVDAPPEQRAVAEKQDRVGDPKPYPGKDIFEQYANLVRAEQLPFVTPDGVSYLWDTDNNRDDGQPLINEPKLKSYPPTDVTGANAATVNTRNLPMREDGSNEFLFEVRQKASQPSLGCSDTQRCSIVVVPIMRMACVESAPSACTSGPAGPPPGTATEFVENHNFFVGAQQWLAESNWRNRIVIPIDFAPDLASCDVRDDRPTVPAFGSELVGVAQQRWGAAYCTGVHQAGYLPVFTPGSEYFARRQLTTRLGTTYQQDAVFVSQPVLDPPRPVAHAPVTISGFAVAFVVDDGNGRQVRNLTLSPRVLAKLVTQSYNPLVVSPDGRKPFTGKQKITDDGTASQYYVAHPALLHNPRSLFADPEFAALNPDFVLSNTTGPLASHLLNTINPMMFTVESDVMIDVFRYLTADPATRAWLDGQPDEYGMRVNPAWLKTAPTQLYSLLDTWVRTAQPRKVNWLETTPENRFFVTGGGDTCDEMFETPYLTKLANVTNSARGAALALLDRRGSATPICTRTDTPIPPDEQAPKPQFPGDAVNLDVRFTETKPQVSDFGRRAQLALTTVSFARLYELPTASLVNAAGKAVSPTAGTMAGALRAAVVDEATGTVQIDHTQVRGTTYPGTMVSYLAVPTAGLDRATALRYADFIVFMATTGQKPGPTLANLPPGYDPLPPALVRQAKDVAAAVRDQKGEVPGAPDGGPLGDGAAPPAADTPAANPGSGLPVAPQSAAADRDVDADPATVAKTEGARSWLARWAIPLLIGFGVLAALVSFGVQVTARRDHPLRRVLRLAGRR